ncbi:MAG: PAS domain S-box protein [Phormidesmis sp.]
MPPSPPFDGRLDHRAVRWQAPALITTGAIIVIALLAANVVLTFRNLRQIKTDANLLNRTQQVVDGLGNLLSLAKDAETGQRGFIITGDPEYLEPYNTAIGNLEEQVRIIDRLTQDIPAQQARLLAVQARLDAKLEELDTTISLRQIEGFEAAQRMVSSNRGKQDMDALRTVIDQMIGEARSRQRIRLIASTQTYRAAVFTGLLSGLSALAALIAYIWLLRRYVGNQAEATELIAQQAEKLKTTLFSIGDGVITTDAAGIVTHLNPVAESLSGWQSDEAIGQPLSKVFRIMNEDTRQSVVNPAERALAEGIIVGLANHTLLIAKDGTELPIDDSAAPIRDRSGNLLGCVLVFRNVTERREQENRLRASQRQFQQIADTMPQIVWVTRADGYHEYYNRRWYDYIGCTPEECIGFGWNQPLHPDDRQRAIERWTTALRTGEPYEIEYRFRAKEGEYRWFLGRALPVRDDAGKIIKWFGTCTDIEDFKQAQKERNNFVRLADNALDFISMSDPAGTLFYINLAGKLMIGLGETGDRPPLTVGELFFAEDRARMLNKFLPSVWATGTGTTDVRFQHLTTAEPIWMRYSATVLNDAQGKPMGLAAISQDMSKQRQMEDNLRQMANDLSEANQRKDEFLATLAHELRNPLAPIRNGLQIMRRSPNNPERMAQVRTMMERQITQMVRLVDDLLDVSRVSRGTFELAKAEVELATIIEQAVETSRPVIEAAGHELRVILPPQPVYLYADSVRLIQVFSNLLNNASKYSEPGGVIRLSTKIQAQTVLVSVKDAGIGIAPDMLPKVFEMFMQVEGALTRSQGGLGIGLTLVKQLVERHGGSVVALSEGVGQGSEFVVRLPVITKVTSMSQPVPAKPIAEGRRRVLIVDDNEDSALTLEMLFEMTGDITQTAHDGLAAITATETFQPDIVLLDIGLPKLNGYEVARQIRQQPGGKGRLLIALTGWGQPEDRRKSSEAGFDAHMVKPIDHEALLQLLSELV